MKRLMIVSALTLALAFGVQLTGTGIAQAGEPYYRHGSEAFGSLAHFYGERQTQNHRYNKDRYAEYRDGRRDCGLAQGRRQQNYPGIYDTCRNAQRGHAAWRHGHWHGNPWHHLPHWTRDCGFYVYRY